MNEVVCCVISWSEEGPVSLGSCGRVPLGQYIVSVSEQ